MTTPSLAEPVTERPDWRDSLGTAADLAVWGIVMFFGCLLGVTAGATVAAASTAVDQWCRTRTMPSAYESWQTARRGAFAGLAAVAVAMAGGALLFVDLQLLSAGAIPGGVPAVAAVGCVSAGFVAVLAVTVIRIGQTGGCRWLAAVRWSVRLMRERPLTAPAVLATVALALVLGLVIPVTSVLLPGFVLFALHVVVRRADSRRP